MTNNPGQIVHVDLVGRPYDIHIGKGLLAQTPALLQPVLNRPLVAIVTDANVAKLHLPNLQKALDSAGIRHVTHIVPAGEASKDFSHLENLCDWLLDAKIERKDLVIALGGGVIGDLTGFAASILRRGVRFVQIPTTLLAQVDSSVGGKTAVNTRHGKNLIGAFHQPVMVLADLDVLATLPGREFRAGYAEIVKYGALGDRDFFGWLDTHLEAVMQLQNEALMTAIAKSCAAKAAIVQRDEREENTRALLNLGHSFGHAYEALTHYSDALLHGEGVAIGMVLALRLSSEIGLCPPADVDLLEKHLARAGLPVTPADITGAPFATADLMTAMAQDKKVDDGVMTLVLAHGLGAAFLSQDVASETLLDFLDRHGSGRQGSGQPESGL